MKNKPKEKKKELMTKFEIAMKKVDDKDNPSTLELEKWLSEVI